MQSEFLPIDYSHFEFQGKDYAQMIGRNAKGQRICIMDSCGIFFWLVLDEKTSEEKTKSLIKKIEKIKLKTDDGEVIAEKIEVTEKNFLSKKVKALKIFTKNYKGLKEFARKIESEKFGEVRGHDLGFITHYIMEKEILPMNWYEISGEIINNSSEFGGIEKVLDTAFCMKLEKVKKIPEKSFTPKAIAYDIETDEMGIGEGEILMVSLASENFKKVITWKKSSEKKPDYVEYVRDERELLEKFAEHVKKISPDFLVGYYSDNFDFPYIKVRADKLKIKLPLGLDGSPPKLGRGINMTGKIKGIVHIDLLKFIDTAYSQYMQSETLSLNEVAKEFLGEEKLKFEFKHSSKIKEDEWDKYYEYNLHDSVLTLKLFEKFWPDLVEFSKVLQEPIFEISRNGMSKNVESYILHHLKNYGEIPESKPSHHELGERINRERYEGAFVFEPIPGLYENLAMFDFTSYWPSIIVTFNLSKSTLLNKKEKDATEAEVWNKKFYFTKKPGFFPEMLKEVIEKRKKYKQELRSQPDVIKKARSNAFKLLANASYGYMGFFGGRYYCPEASGAATAIGREFIKKTISEINQEGYTTVYSDTDSIAFLINNKVEKQVKEFLERINSELPGIMELELEDFYKRGIWVTTRAGTAGAKKKYALITNEGKVKIRGFETVRRDWCQLARKLQDNVLRKILNEGNEKSALEYVKEIITKLKNRDIEKKDILIRTQLKKPLSEYKAISPHVIAARKMKEREIPISHGGLVEYFIAETREKKKLVREKVKLPDEIGEYNIEYYLEKQILPSVENIFQIFGIDLKQIIEGKKQKTLSEF